MAGVPRAVRRALCGRARWALALLALAALLALRVPRDARSAAEFPRHAPAALAHFLADFSNYPQLYDHISGPWHVEEEWSNYTCWRYAVSYACGARCAGRAELAACADARDAHRVRLRDRRCWGAPWPYACESLETDSVVSARAGGGALLRERARAPCAALAALAGRCDVRAARAALHARLRDALPEPPPPA